MKNNIFGYIFILFIIAIMGFAIYRVQIRDNKTETDENKLSSTSIQDVKKGTEMTLGISNFDTINPIITKNKRIQDIDKLIYEPLINVTEDYKLDYVLARECAKSTNNSYIVKLRQGVKWSDGSKFTSDDVKFTIDRLNEEGSKSIYSENVKNIQEIVDNIKEKLPLCEIYVQSIYPVNSTKDSTAVGIRTNEKIISINKKIKELCNDEKITYVNMYDLLTDDDGNLNTEYTKEGLHISDKGYEFITKIIKENILK